MTTNKSQHLDGQPGFVSSPEAFEEFYREQLPLVRVYLARRLDDPQLAADLTAEVFCRAIQRAHSYRQDLGPPRAWLIGIARNVLADQLRHRTREGLAMRRAGMDLSLDEDSAQRIVDRIAAERDARALLASIAELSEPLRHVVELVAVDGVSIAEAAAVLGIRPATARVRYHRARRELNRTSPTHLIEVTS